MKGILLILVWLLSKTLCSSIIELTTDNFSSYIKHHLAVMVEFYSHECSHSKSFELDYENAGTKVIESYRPYILTRLNVDTEEVIADKYHIATLPTFKLFMNGYPIEYNEERNVNVMIEFIEKVYRDIFPSTEVNSIEDLTKRVIASGTEAILITGNSQHIKLFKDISRNYMTVEFFHTSEEIGKEVFKDVVTFPAIILLRGVNNERLTYNGSLYEKEINEFIKMNTRPVIREFDQETITRLFNEVGYRGIILIREGDDEGRRVEILFEELALRHRGDNFIFVISSAKEGLGKRVANMLKIEETNLPHMEIVEKGKELQRYKYSNSFDIVQMDQFVVNWITSNSIKKIDL